MLTLRNQVCLWAFIISCSWLSLPGAQAAPPAEAWLVWESNRADARSEVYLARADGTQVTRMTKTGAYRPSWSPDGRWILYFDDAGDQYLVRPDGSDRHVVYTGWVVSWLHDNAGLLVIEGIKGFALDPETKARKQMFDMADFPQLAGTDLNFNGMTHDNRYIVFGSHLYINGFTGTNGSFVSEYSAVVADVLHKDRTYFFGTGCWPFTPPAGDLIFHICGNCPTFPDIYRMSLNDLDTRASYAPEMAHPNEDWGHEYNPRVSNDNKYMVYMASTGCHQGSDCNYDIWMHEIGAGPDNRVHVIENPSFDGYPQLYVGPLWKPTTEPRLLVTPSRVTFLATTGAAIAPQTLAIKNDGGGTLGAASVTVDSAPWLDVKQEGNAVTLSVREGTTITRGNRCANLTIDVPGAQGSPVVVPVVLFGDETFPASPDAGAPDASIASWQDGGVLVSVDASGSSDAGVAVVYDASSASDCDAAFEPAAPVVDGGAPGPVPMEKGNAGCGCRLGGATSSSALSLLAMLGLLALRRRRG
jgi:MYXO-CTERM domain-containing protein